MESTDLIPIGAAARRLGLSTSALRYYDEIGLVRPAVRRGGRRMYGPRELRRLALVCVVTRLGLSLEAAAAILDESGERWRAGVRGQMDALDTIIERARTARTFLSHALECPADHPTRECPQLIGMLDRLVDGMTFEQLAAEQLAAEQLAAGQLAAGQLAAGQLAAGQSAAGQLADGRSAGVAAE